MVSQLVSGCPAVPASSCMTVCKPGESFSCFLTLLLCRGIGHTTSPSLALGILPPKLTRQLEIFVLWWEISFDPFKWDKNRY